VRDWRDRRDKGKLSIAFFGEEIGETNARGGKDGFEVRGWRFDVPKTSNIELRTVIRFPSLALLTRLC
jgi:hypothetical protein